MLLKMENLLRIFSAAMALLFMFFFSSPDIPLFATPYFWIGMGYLIFLMFKKYLYYWKVGSLKNLVVEGAEFIFIIYIHQASTSPLSAIFYISFMIRIVFLYPWKAFLPIILLIAMGNIMINWHAVNFLVARDSLFMTVYSILLFIGTCGGALVLVEIHREQQRQKEQLKGVLSVKETLIRELDQSREQLRINNEELYHLANTDGLTGLYNHKYFHEYLDNMFSYLEDNEDTLALLIIDLDQFKQYNDTYGHLAGDVILRDLGKILTQCAGENDVVARYGGDEFAIILPGQGEEKAQELCEKIKESLKRYGQENPRFTKIGISIGIASNTIGIKNKEELITQADRNMYIQKKI